MSGGRTTNWGCGSLVLAITGVFIVLRATGTVDWSWWWVLSPIVAYVAFSIIVIVVAAFIVALNDMK